MKFTDTSHSHDEQYAAAVREVGLIAGFYETHGRMPDRSESLELFGPAEQRLCGTLTYVTDEIDGDHAC